MAGNSSYDIVFTAESLRRVHAFSYILVYSSRHYLRFVDAEDLAPTLREHVCAFEHFSGLATTCLNNRVLRVNANGTWTHEGFRSRESSKQPGAPECRR